jgi:transcriptional regulator with XRE-family HTH domain
VVKKELGKRIAALRKRRGLSQEELAQLTGYSVAFLSLVERGINAPSVAGLDRIAQALDVEIRELFDLETEAR